MSREGDERGRWQNGRFDDPLRRLSLQQLRAAAALHGLHLFPLEPGEGMQRGRDEGVQVLFDARGKRGGRIMNAKRAKKLIQIARYYGEEKQVCKLIEELGEAVSAASEVQMLLSFREDGGKGTDLQGRLEHLAAELADVQNLTEQVLLLFGLEVDFKVARMDGIDKTLDQIGRETERQVELCDTN